MIKVNEGIVNPSMVDLASPSMVERHFDGSFARRLVGLSPGSKWRVYVWIG